MNSLSDSPKLYFEIYLDVERKYRWRLCENNITAALGYFIIATSHQGYPTKDLCLYDIERVRLASRATRIDDKTLSALK
jgi:uncharacterized protein YegP (UPF0339 family)